MVFKELRIMRGPNMWSRDHHNIIAVKYIPEDIPALSAEQFHAVQEYFLLNFNDQQRSEQNTLSQFKWTIRLAALLQDKNFSHDLASPSPDILYGILQYKTEQGGLAALETAAQIITALVSAKEPVSFLNASLYIKEINLRNDFGPSTKIIVEAAQARNIPVQKGPAGYIILGQGENQQRISAARTAATSAIATNIACDKEDTRAFLESSHLPVPKGVLTEDLSHLQEIADSLGFPLVTKPLSGNHGRNVTCKIKTVEELIAGFSHAQERSPAVIIEKEIQGDDYRLLLVGNKMVAASKRSPAQVTGNGISSVIQLVNKENENSHRGEGHENILTRINLDRHTESILAKQGLMESSVPKLGERIYLKQTANLSTGGTAEDVTDSVHPLNIMLAERAAKIIGLDICGIDIISPDIAVPLSENGGAIIEVNAAPGLRMHQYPSAGISRDVGKPVIDLMFGENQDGRIPIVAVTGTNGKTTTTRLMAFIADYAGKKVGFSSTDGIYIGSHKIYGGDCSGPQSARTILQEPNVNFAVLECARGGIIRSGLGFDECDIAIVTNVAADHLGMKDVHSVEDLAMVKSVVPASVKKNGWAILNAGNELTYRMKQNLNSNVAVFALDGNNENLLGHVKEKGTAIFTDADQEIYLVTETEKFYICNAVDIPLTRKGKAGFMIENVLPVILASYLSGFPIKTIVSALKSFQPSEDTTPGRINEFKINGVNVIVDYAHNPHGLRALAGYLKNVAGHKTGIITGTGDRRTEDIIEFGRIAAQMYDEIIIRFDRDLRGRSRESITELLMLGIREIDDRMTCTVIPDTQTAIHTAVDNAAKESYVVVCADNATYTIGLTKKIAELYRK